MTHTLLHMESLNKVASLTSSDFTHQIITMLNSVVMTLQSDPFHFPTPSALAHSHCCPCLLRAWGPFQNKAITHLDSSSESQSAPYLFPFVLTHSMFCKRVWIGFSSVEVENPNTDRILTVAILLYCSGTMAREYCTASHLPYITFTMADDDEEEPQGYQFLCVFGTKYCA